MLDKQTSLKNMRKNSIWTKRNKKSLPISRRTMPASLRLPKNAKGNSRHWLMPPTSLGTLDDAVIELAAKFKTDIVYYRKSIYIYA
jgi:hypothetical protein